MFKKGIKLEENQRNYISEAFGAFILILIVKHFWPEVIPFGTFEFWKIKQGNVLDWLLMAWPLFAWGAGLTVLVRIFSRNSMRENSKAEELFGLGFLSSLRAGVLEEVSFRWLIFMNAITGIKLTNWLFFGWLGLGLPEWFQLHLTGPIVNWTTFGYLHEYLTNPVAWAIGAAIISANAFFRDGHRYLGFVGWTNAWFVGLFFFWVTFHYGLIAAIVIHFTYDFLLDIVCYMDRVIERKMGLSNGL